uniref:F-BAR domain-containing protein n=1 Tax=Gongylonema pulchrum TaxID=637853 RepID=A0A183DCD5_9BILA
LQERVDIETSYSKCLQAYNDKWSTHIGGLAASALQDVWRDVLEESMELQRLHGHVRDRICEEILKTIALYLKDNHHPSPFRASKELREIEEDFERAQRTWRRQYEKVEKAKKAFHAASKAERTAQVQMRNACGDATISLDIESKQRDRYQKCQDELAKTERAYCATLENLNNMKKSYISHMSDVC